MAFRKFVRLDEDGYIDATCEGDISDPVSPGLIEVPVETDLRDATFRHFDAETKAIGDKRQDPLRVITRGEFMDRWPIDTQLALEEIAEGPNEDGRKVRVFNRRLDAQQTVDLDSPILVAALAEIAAILLKVGAHGWATQEQADAMAASILA